MRQRIIGSDIIEYGDKVNSFIENDVTEKINKMSVLLNDIKWNGIAKDRFSNSYKNVMFEIKKIPNVLKLYIKFLSVTMDNYEELMVELKKSFDELENDLNIKGDINDEVHES